jgi:two-component system OmpR family response regulator
VRILLLEDNADLADAITSRLKSKDFVVDITSNIQAAESALAVGSFDLALFDLSLPDGSSLALLQKLRRQGKTIPVIIITARDQISDRITGLEAGADDYLVKPFDLDEMIARIHTIMRRYEGNPNPVIKFGNIQIDQSGHRVFVSNVEVELTAKEWAVVQKLSSQPGHIFSKEQMEATLYNFESDVGSNTLEVYVSRIRKKLGKDHIETVRGLGYRFKKGEN